MKVSLSCVEAHKSFGSSKLLLSLKLVTGFLVKLEIVFRALIEIKRCFFGYVVLMVGFSLYSSDPDVPLEFRVFIRTEVNTVPFQHVEVNECVGLFHGHFSQLVPVLDGGDLGELVVVALGSFDD